MMFFIHLLTNTGNLTYAAASEESGHVIYFNKEWLQILPPGSLRFPEKDHLATSRSFKLDLKMLNALVGDHMGKYSYSLTVRFNGVQHMTLKYFDPSGENKRTIEIYKGSGPAMDKLLGLVYPIFENIHAIVFNEEAAV